MTVLGIGADIVERARIETALARFGDRFARRVLTRQEHDQWFDRGAPASLLARRFAAKEAVSKAFGCGIGSLIGFQDIEVAHDPRGAPRVVLHGRGDALARRRQVTRCHLTITDERLHALAFVVLEGT